MHGDPGRRHDVGRGDLTRALLAQVHGDRLVLLGGHDQLLEVQDDVGDILLHPRDGGELVQHPVDADARDRRTRDRRQQGPPQRVAERVAEAGLERLDGEPGPGLVDRLLAEGRSLGNQHFLSSFPAGARHMTPKGVAKRGRALDASPRSITSSRTRRSAVPEPEPRSAPARAAGARGPGGWTARPAARPGSAGRRRTPWRPRTAAPTSTSAARR